MHGTDDQLVSYAEGVGVFHGIPGPKRLITIEGGDHGSWFGAEATVHDEVATVTTDFLLAHLTDDTVAHSRLEAGRSSPDASFVYGPEPGTTVTVPSPATDADRTATVDPSTGLTDGQVVTVTWDGYLPGGTVNVIQCAAGGTEGASLCDLTQGRILQPNPTGAGSIELEIIVGPVGEGTCTAATDDCVVAVNDSGLSDPDATIRIPISLAG